MIKKHKTKTHLNYITVYFIIIFKKIGENFDKNLLAANDILLKKSCLPMQQCNVIICLRKCLCNKLGY